jgi:nucleotide-binding universal stress UspA family protein
METILVPTDFTENAMHAARFAAMIAKEYDAKILFLNVYTIPMVLEYKAASHMNTDMSKIQKISELNLTQFSDEFIRKTNFSRNNVSQLASYGSIADVTIEKTKGHEIDMVVMGANGTYLLIDRLFGTHSQKVGKLAHCPVWIIPDNASLEHPRKMLYAADFEENEAVAIAALLKITNPLNLIYKVLHVHEYFEPKDAETIEYTMEILRFFFENDSISFKEINRPNIIKGLEKYIDGYNPDVIAFAMHKKSFLSNIFHSSISGHFLMKPELPILTFRN